MKLFAILALTGGTALLPAAALAQAQPAGGAQPPASAPAQPAKPLTAAEFVDRAAISNMFEIQSSQLALDKAGNNPQIKAFAQRMIGDHTAASEKLKAVAQNQTIPNSLDAQHQQLLKQLQAASGEDFSRLYLAMQVTAHQLAVSLFDQYAQHGDNAGLKQFAQNTLPVLRDHLQAATNLRISLAGPNQASTQTPNAGGQQAQADASRIVVQQPAPRVQVQQASPEVTVQQVPPQVTVRQPQPEIIVRQPQPTVRVDIPQPEIIVRMPPPDVNVAMARPQVQVNQPAPQVQIVQPQQPPQVQVQREQPQVQIQAAAGQPNVQVQREGQPNVRYERTGDPNVIVSQPQGQPTIRFEPMGQGNPGQHASLTDQDRQRARQRVGADDAKAIQAAGNPKLRPVTIKQLDDMDVYNAKGEKLGEVEQVIVDQKTNQHYVVISHGGWFLGIGEDLVAFPLDRFWMRGDRLVIRGVTDQDIENMANYRDQVQNFRRLADNDRAELRLWE